MILKIYMEKPHQIPDCEICLRLNDPEKNPVRKATYYAPTDSQKWDSSLGKNEMVCDVHLKAHGISDNSKDNVPIVLDNKEQSK